MIVFDLTCATGHQFEGWFGSADEFSSQHARGLVSCPSCGANNVRRVPSATRYNAGVANAGRSARTEDGAEMLSPPASESAVLAAHSLYTKLVQEVLSKTEDVGKAFPDEARRIHYGESESRAIRGVATQGEHDALIEEGIPVRRFPIPTKESMN